LNIGPNIGEEIGHYCKIGGEGDEGNDDAVAWV